MKSYDPFLDLHVGNLSSKFKHRSTSDPRQNLRVMMMMIIMAMMKMMMIW